MMSNIHLLNADHINDICRWLVEIPLFQRYGLTAAAFTGSLHEALRRDDWLLVATDEASHATFGFAWVMQQGAFGRSAYLRLIAVHPDHAGGGLGAALLDHAEALAREARRDLFLLVSDFNVDAHRFYEKHGYSQLGTIPGYVLPDVDELIYWKCLVVR